MDLLGGARASHEQEDLEDLTAVGHRQDLRHPRADPLEVLGRLDDPDEGDATDGGGALVVSLDEVADVRDLVGDTDTGGEEHDGAVRGQILVSVGTLDESRGNELAGGALLNLLVESVGEASTAADKKAHSGLAEARKVEAIQGHAFLLTPCLLLLAPGKREGVRGPPANRRKVQVDVLASLEPPGAGDLKVDAEAVTGEGFDLGLGTTVAEVAENDPEEAHEALDDPDGKDGLHDIELVELTSGTVDPDTGKTKSGEQDVEVKEDLVEGVADRTSGLDEDDQEGQSALLLVSQWSTSARYGCELTIVPQRMNSLLAREPVKASQPPFWTLGTR